MRVKIVEYCELELNMAQWTPSALRVKWQALQRNAEIYLAPKRAVKWEDSCGNGGARDESILR